MVTLGPSKTFFDHHSFLSHLCGMCLFFTTCLPGSEFIAHSYPHCVYIKEWPAWHSRVFTTCVLSKKGQCSHEIRTDDKMEERKIYFSVDCTAKMHNVCDRDDDTRSRFGHCVKKVSLFMK